MHCTNSEINDSNKDDTSDNVYMQMELSNNSNYDCCRDNLSQNNSEDVEKNNDSESNDSNAEYLSKKISQETKYSRKLFPNASRKICRKMKKVEKFNCKKGAREKVLRDNLCHVLAHNIQNVGIEECGNITKFYGTITSGNEKCGCNFHSMTFQ